MSNLCQQVFQIKQQFAKFKDSYMTEISAILEGKSQA
jgi:hypothetical protein